MSSTLKIIATAGVCLALAACAVAPTPGPNTVSSTGPGVAPSGITASNGGGQRATGNIPSIGITNGVVRPTGAPNTTGNAY